MGKVLSLTSKIKAFLLISLLIIALSIAILVMTKEEPATDWRGRFLYVANDQTLNRFQNSLLVIERRLRRDNLTSVMRLLRSFQSLAWRFEMTSLWSVHLDGTQRKQHPLVCDGQRVTPVSQVARSSDGKTLAFVLPQRSEREEDPSWIKLRYSQLGRSERTASDLVQHGEIYLFDVETNACRPTGLEADNQYDQTLAFSPDGQYLAYVNRSLWVYNVKTKEKRNLTSRRDDSTMITGPLLWNSAGTALYYSIHDGLAVSFAEKKRGYLEKVELNQEKVVTTNVWDLAPLIIPPHGVNWSLFDLPDDFVYPDDPTVYAISPDETKVAFEYQGNLVIGTIGTPERPFEEVYNRREDCIEDETWGHPRHLTWTKHDALLFEISCCGCTSSMGTTLVSNNAQKATRLPVDQAHGYSLNLEQNMLVYNFDFFGDYHLPQGEPRPTGSKTEGHRYDGVGVLNLETNESVKFSGRDGLYGRDLLWFE